MNKTVSFCIAFALVLSVSIGLLGLAAIARPKAVAKQVSRAAPREARYAPPETRQARSSQALPDTWQARPAGAKRTPKVVGEFLTSVIWSSYELDRPDFDEKFDGNYVDIVPYPPLGLGIERDDNGYFFLSVDYNARLRNPIYLREKDAHEISTMMRQKKFNQELRLRVLVTGNPGLTWTDGHLVHTAR